jgi:hypothetical protein
MSFVEYEVDALAFNPEVVTAVGVTNKTVSYYIAGTPLNVTYGTQAEAILAYDEFIAFKNLPDPINIGDTVRLRGEQIPHQLENVAYIVTNVPTANFPWWAMTGQQTLTTYVMAIGDGMIIELITVAP